MVPVLRENHFHGFAYASLDFNNIKELLISSFNNWSVQTTCLDSKGHVVASTRPELETMQIFDPKANGEIRVIDDLTYKWIPVEKNLPEIVRWKRSYYKRKFQIAPDIPWTLVVEALASPHIESLQNIYIYNLAVMLLLALLTLLFAEALSRWLVNPLSKLAEVTTNLPDKLLDHQTINWPNSSVKEIDLLVHNIKSMKITLNQKFQEAKSAATILEQRFEERINMGAQLQASLREKEMLLKEIHHRVKNNMQVISSLLRLQSEYNKDDKVIEMFKESQNRIRSIALVHEKLYRSKNLSRIDFNSYIENLVNGLFISYRISSNKVRLKMDVGRILFAIDTAIPCGLIINELITNSLKHAFPEDREGEISISLHKANTGKNEYELIVEDNGVGIWKDLDYRNTETLGLQLVTSLAEIQLHGRIELNKNKGTKFRVIFSEI